MAEQDWAEEHAHEIVGEWLRADFRGDASVAGRGMLERLIEQRLRDTYARGHQDGMEDSAKVAEAYWKDGKNVYARHAGRAVERRIRTLAQLPGGEEGEDE